MTYSKQRLREITALKKEAVRRIQTDILEIGAAPSRKYIEDFHEEFSSYESVSTPEEILSEALRANIIWIGDYHALPASQAYAVEILKQVAGFKDRVALAVEPVFARKQEVLDSWMTGRISEQEFLEGIRYQEQWGCEWAGYKAMFDAARQLRIPVYGVDDHPRNDMRRIGRRDLNVARRIARLVEADPGRTLVVVFGESHLAVNHLPGRVRRILDRRNIASNELLILQNLEALYWQAQESGEGEARAVRIRQGSYGVFNVTPIEKYESFRQYLHRCIEEDFCGDWTLLAQTLAELMMDFLSVKNNESLLGHMPMIDGLQLAAAAEAFARRIHQACRGELEQRFEREVDDQFFVTVIENGLGYFCSKLLDSSRDGIEPLAERVLSQIGRNDRLTEAIGLLVDPGSRPSAEHFAALRAAAEAKAGKPKTRALLSQLLGYALGRRLYLAYLQSRISRKQIHAIFHDPLNTRRRPLECYRELTSRY
jgi:heme-binding uptake protein ChaN (Tiki superfamily)